jgi:hypothetical protein
VSIHVEEATMDKLSIETVASRILVIRGQRVMLDRDLAEMYGVETFNLNKAVNRNIIRFPADFMFRLTSEGFKNLTFQSGISRWGGRRHLPYVFTQEGVAMLSSVLHSKRAIQANISIMRAFVRLRDILDTHKELASQIEALELKYKNHDGKLTEHESQISIIFEAIRQLLKAPEPSQEPEKPKIGFRE